MPSELAGGKLRLRYPSVLGGSQNLEVPTLTIDEVAAGKFAALVQRTVARDAFDVANLLGVAPDLLQRPAFRVAFVCFVAGSRADARELRAREQRSSNVIVERDLEPLLRRGAQAHDMHGATLATWIEGTLDPIPPALLSWSPEERHFLDRLLDEGELEPSALHRDLAVQDRIRNQPMLAWKAKHVRARRGKT